MWVDISNHLDIQLYYPYQRTMVDTNNQPAIFNVGGTKEQQK